MSWDDEEPTEEWVLGSTAHLLASMGDEQAWLLLEDVRQLSLAWEPRGPEREGPWGDKVQLSECVVYLDVEPYLQPRFTPDVLGRILPIIRTVAERLKGVTPDHLETRPAMPNIDVSTWRQDLRRVHGGDEVSNQARHERTAPDTRVADGLAFSNAHELAVYQSLLRLQESTPEERTFAIAPLPGVHIRAGHTWTPDIVVLGNGRAMIIEVDGPQHGREHRRADDDIRDHQWRRCGLPVRRVPVEFTRPERVKELDGYLRETVREALYPNR